METIKQKIVRHQQQHTVSAGSATRRAKQWKRFHRRTAELFLLHGGLALDWADPTTEPAPREVGGKPLTQEEECRVDEMLEEMIKKGQAREVSEEEAFFVSPIFMVPKKTKPGEKQKYRFIHDLRQLNRYITVRPFKMEDLRDVKEQLQEGMWMCSLDLAEAYTSVGIRPTHHRFLQFRHRGKLYCHTVLPYGYQLAPRTFTKLLKPVLAHIREKYGVAIAVHVDDVWSGDVDKDKLVRAMAELMQLLQHLGLNINFKKSDLQPSRRVEWCGCIIDSSTMMLSCPQDKLNQYRKLTRSLLRTAKRGRRVAFPDLERLMGQLGSLMHMVSDHRLHCNFLLMALNTNEGFIQLSSEALEELEWWSENMFLFNGAPARLPPHTVKLQTDSSTQGWGGARVDLHHKITVAGRWGALATLHINAKETRAVLLTLQAIHKVTPLSQQSVLVECDNITAVMMINKQRARSPELARQLQDLMTWCRLHHVILTAIHLPGVLNTLADSLSRQRAEYCDRALNYNIFKALHRLMDYRLTLDCFAAAHNALLPRYLSWQLDPGAVAQDFFSLHIPMTERAWMNPPFILLPRVINKIVTDRITGWLVAPLTPSSMWFNMLPRVMAGPPILLPQIADLFITPGTMTQEQEQPPPWPTVVIPISQGSSGALAWRQQLSGSCWKTDGSLEAMLTRSQALLQSMRPLSRPSSELRRALERITSLICLTIDGEDTP
jgi:hypothetical protein